MKHRCWALSPEFLGQYIWGEAQLFVFLTNLKWCWYLRSRDHTSRTIILGYDLSAGKWTIKGNEHLKVVWLWKASLRGDKRGWTAVYQGGLGSDRTRALPCGLLGGRQDWAQMKVDGPFALRRLWELLSGVFCFPSEEYAGALTEERDVSCVRRNCETPLACPVSEGSAVHTREWHIELKQGGHLLKELHD